EIFSPTVATSQVIAVDISAPGFTTRHISVDVACALRILAAPSGAVLTLDSTTGLAVGTRLLLSTPDGAGVEFTTVIATGPGASQVTLAQAPTILFPANSPVQPLPANQAVALHREPVIIGGRVIKRAGATVTALANADVRVSKIWVQV